MAINLTTAFDPGDMDSGTYAEAKIIGFAHDSVAGNFVVTVEYGNTVSGDWVAGVVKRSTLPPIQDDPDADPAVTDYTDFVTANQATYDAMKAALYAWLQTNYAQYAGTVV